MHHLRNLFQMYMENNCRFGFFVTRESWSDGKYAKVIGIDGAKEGEPLEGEPPYFIRKYPAGHAKAGITWKRNVYLEADWLDGGGVVTGSGGTYSWRRVYPLEQK